MNILIVTQYFWPENFPINSLTSGLIEKGHKITVLTGIPNYPSGRFFMGYGIFRNLRQNYKGARVIRVPLVPRGKGGVMSLILNYLSFAFFASVLAPFVCRGRYDVIFVYEPSPITVGLPAIVLKRVKSAKIMFWVQDIWPETLSATGAIKFPLFLRIAKQLTHFIYRQCDLILAQSKAFIPSVQSSGIGIDRIRYFPNSAEEFYRPVKLSDNAQERKVMPRGFIVMFAGNIGVAQDFKTILSAAERLKGYPDIYWVVIGEGRMRGWVEDAVKTRNLDRTFLLFNRQPPEKMPAYFSLADALLVTLRKSEIFKLTIPSKLQPYLACGRPVIAALEGEGARIIEESRSGFSCRTEDPDALAKLVLRMYHTEESVRQAMGSSGRLYFEKNFEQKMLLGQLDRMMHGLKRRETECVS